MLMHNQFSKLCHINILSGHYIACYLGVLINNNKYQVVGLLLPWDLWKISDEVYCNICERACRYRQCLHFTKKFVTS